MPVISPNKPYRIGRSRTGLGLFATKPIKKGTKIIRYSGRMLDCTKEKDDAVENKYLFQITSRWTIDGSMRSNVARYINHSCKPNAESDVRKIKRRVDIRAIKDIAPGEEINYDYGTEYFKEYLKPIGCKCDSCEKKRKKLRAAAREEKKRSRARAEKRAGAGGGRRKLNGHKAHSGVSKKSKVLSTAKGRRSKKHS
ncbi:Nuclear protein SET [Nitrobacter sp. Nb-311A]|uniref:SET domain-containing protein n=1 Tax=unclassified Nitrobacter TaxID=2620411 RepID=UPI00006873F3|nr:MULTISPECIES: SET domain-containing protein [unclassified Nitrobacter]EAQ35462.1 Nuclear protein SET [Nitrobacter sp. Nb-311A]MCB1392497.1 SET domain-containing protein [Nitrobacter sp.]MCV0385127.1 SET domain-containing protein [Nitrobacter sp.]